MALNMESINIHELTSDSLYWRDEESQDIEINTSQGAGYFSHVIHSRNELTIMIQDFSLHRDMKLYFPDMTPKTPAVFFQSHISTTPEQVSYAQPRVSLGPGFSNIYMNEEHAAVFLDLKSNVPVRTFSVCINPISFEELTGRSLSNLMELMDLLVYKNKKKCGLLRSKDIDIAQMLCTSQAIASYLEWPEDSFFLEAKSLELIALQLKQLDFLLKRIPEKKKPAAAVEKISYACEILRKEMANPPEVQELSRRVGLSYNQLLLGFKESVGITPSEYLRIIRLERAYTIITNNENNVTEAAFEVGYSSLGHFTTAFKKEFGINPKAHAMKNKKKLANFL